MAFNRERLDELEARGKHASRQLAGARQEHDRLRSILVPLALLGAPAPVRPSVLQLTRLPSVALRLLLLLPPAPSHTEHQLACWQAGAHPCEWPLVIVGTPLPSLIHHTCCLLCTHSNPRRQAAAMRRYRPVGSDSLEAQRLHGVAARLVFIRKALVDAANPEDGDGSSGKRGYATCALPSRLVPLLMLTNHTSRFVCSHPHLHSRNGGKTSRHRRKSNLVLSLVTNGVLFQLPHTHTHTHPCWHSQTPRTHPLAVACHPGAAPMALSRIRHWGMATSP